MNIKQIEKMYGRKLQYMISQQREIQEEFSYIEKYLNEIDDRISNQLSEHDDKIESYVSCLDEIHRSIESIVVDIEEIKDMLLRLDD